MSAIINTILLPNNVVAILVNLSNRSSIVVYIFRISIKTGNEASKYTVKFGIQDSAIP